MISYPIYLLYNIYILFKKIWNHYTLLGICPPTPPLSQHFVLSEKWVLMLAWGGGGVGGQFPRNV